MKSFMFAIIALGYLCAGITVEATPTSTGGIISAFLDASGIEKDYVDPTKIAFLEDEILLLSENGSWESISFLGKDSKGFYISGFRGKNCPNCNKLMYDGMCTNVQCSEYMQ